MKNYVQPTRHKFNICHVAQAMSGQQYDEEAQQSAYISSESHGQIGTSPSVSVGARPPSAANSPAIQPSLVAAEALAVAQHLVPTQASAADANAHEQQQTTASNDGLNAVGSYDAQQDAAAASVHATALEEDLPASDAETDLSSVGLQRGRQRTQSRHQRLKLTHRLRTHASLCDDCRMHAVYC